MSSRKLTAGEIAAARTIFGANLNYVPIDIHRGKYVFFQPNDIAMAPNGDVYFPEAVYKPDFSLTPSDMSWMIHELTHCWQYQHGMWVRLRGVLEREYDYGDLGSGQRTFGSFKLEQQASIVSDYFRITRGLRPRKGRGTPEQYRALIPFLPRGGRK